MRLLLEPRPGPVGRPSPGRANPSEIRQLMAHVKTHVVARRNARGGRSAAEHLVAALRCLYRHAEDDGLITDADNPARKVAKPRRLPSIRRGRSGHPAGGDQRGRCHDWQRPRPRHGDCCGCTPRPLSPRRRPGPAPAGPRPGPVPDLAAGEGGDGALAAGLAHSRAALPAPGPASGRPGRRARAVPAGAMALIWLADSSRHWVHQRPYSPLLILSSSRDAGSTTPTDRYRGLPLVRCPAEPPGVVVTALIGAGCQGSSGGGRRWLRCRWLRRGCRWRRGCEAPACRGHRVRVRR